jgi:hypothetical protein
MTSWNVYALAEAAAERAAAKNETRDALANIWGEMLMGVLSKRGERFPASDISQAGAT